MCKDLPMISKEIFLASLETLKNCEPGTPEFELGYQLIMVYKIYIDRKEGRIIERPRFLGENV